MGAQKKIRAVFISDLSPIMAPLIPAWTQAGHEIAAIIGHQGHKSHFKKARRFARTAPQWSFSALSQRHAPEARLLLHGPDNGWAGLGETIEGLKPDILVCAFFMRRIPRQFIDLFPGGAVNLHPALLPQFRGPLPVHHMLAAGLHEVHGGVTLHEMSERFDQGPIIAQARMPHTVWDDRVMLGAGIAGAAAELVARALPAWCAGDLQSVPQEEGGHHHWAGLQPDGFEITPEWDFDRVQRAARVLSRRPGLRVRVNGTDCKVRGRIVRLGPPSGARPETRGRSVAFDVADARILATPLDPVSRLLAGRAERRQWSLTAPIKPSGIIYPHRA